MVEIGKPLEEPGVIVEPIKDPLPREKPAPVKEPEPVKKPEREKVPA